jgi:hypothetical protein
MVPDPFIRHPTGADALVEGYYLIQRRRSGRVDLPVKVWFGPPVDEDGIEMDRSWRWQVRVGGLDLDEPTRVGSLRINSLDDIWPACAVNPIDKAEYDYRIERAAWAAENDPDDPFGTDSGIIDPMTAPLPFLEDCPHE